MRVTNTMITDTTKSNINRAKVQVNKMNTQMTTQKKIDVPSDDPVVAVRSLRFRSTLNQIDQYLNTNVKDAESWLDITQSSLKSLESIVSDIHKQCVDGSTGHLTQDDRNTILANLQQLREQIYDDGNTDYAGRTIFTGYKTNSTLTFLADSTASYSITEPLSYNNIEEKNYYTNTFEALASVPATDPTDLTQVTNQRIRLSYNSLSDATALSFSYGSGTAARTVSFNTTTGAATVLDSDGNPVVGETSPFTFSTMTTTDMQTADYAVGANQIILNKDTGELMLGSDVSTFLKTNKADVSVTYDKTGFKDGELRPEHYFNCTDKTDAANPIKYINYDADGNRTYEDINYFVGNNQTITVNTLGADTFNAAIGRDVDELSDAVQFAINSYDTVEKLKQMQSSSAYSSDADQEMIEKWLTAANKQLDYANENMEKLYNQKLTSFTGYESDINLALTNVGSKGQRLDLVKNRLESQMTTVEKLKSSNEDRELSDVVIDYTAAYTSYQAALQAASKVQEQTLLDYL